MSPERRQGRQTPRRRMHTVISGKPAYCAPPSALDPSSRRHKAVKAAFRGKAPLASCPSKREQSRRFAMSPRERQFFRSGGSRKHGKRRPQRFQGSILALYESSNTTRRLDDLLAARLGISQRANAPPRPCAASMTGKMLRILQRRLHAFETLCIPRRSRASHGTDWLPGRARSPKPSGAHNGKRRGDPSSSTGYVLRAHTAEPRQRERTRTAFAQCCRRARTFHPRRSRVPLTRVRIRNQPCRPALFTKALLPSGNARRARFCAGDILARAKTLQMGNADVVDKAHIGRANEQIWAIRAGDRPSPSRR